LSQDKLGISWVILLFAYIRVTFRSHYLPAQSALTICMTKGTPNNATMAIVNQSLLITLSITHAVAVSYAINGALVAIAKLLHQLAQYRRQPGTLLAAHPLQYLQLLVTYSE
jgi:hypothetical protein